MQHYRGENYIDNGVRCRANDTENITSYDAYILHYSPKVPENNPYGPGDVCQVLRVGNRDWNPSRPPRHKPLHPHQTIFPTRSPVSMNNIA
jgi:hypothetical protein